MTSINQAFKAVSPGAISLDSVHGGLPVDKNLSHGDLAGLSEMPYLFGMAYYGGDFSGLGKLHGMFSDFSLTKAQHKGWRVDNPDLLINASKMAIDMHIFPQLYSFCRTCGGSGSQRGTRVGLDCKSCEGTGKKNRSDAELSRQIGVSRTNMKRTWNDRLNYLYSEVQEFHSNIANHLNARE